ncbi:MAG: hypothetical protein ACRDD7_00665 [Peptostreptococcaceae bacterium]
MISGSDFPIIKKLIEKYAPSGGGSGSGLKVKNINVPSSNLTLIDGLFRTDVTHGISGNIQGVNIFNSTEEIVAYWKVKDDSTITIANDLQENLIVKILYI